jgi:predicted phage-related endonuclease
VLECKTINEYSLKTLLKQGLANHPDYIFQIQHSLGVTGYKWGIFAFPRADLVELPVVSGEAR